MRLLLHEEKGHGNYMAEHMWSPRLTKLALKDELLLEQWVDAFDNSWPQSADQDAR